MAKNASFVLSSFSAAQWPAADRPEVAFVGRSNVGKSSCLNTLLGRSDMARVSKTPGRTQSINFFDLEHQGRELRFADLPGYGFAKAPKRVKKDWDRMIGEYLRDRASLALVVVLVDIRREPTVLDRQMIGWLEEAERTGLLVITKSDKVSKNQRLNRQSKLCQGLDVPREATVLFSSVNRDGRGRLWSRIVEACDLWGEED